MIKVIVHHSVPHENRLTPANRNIKIHFNIAYQQIKANIEYSSTPCSPISILTHLIN